MARRQNFIDGANQGFAQAAHEAMIATLRQLAEAPEQASVIAARDSASKREQEAADYEKTQRPLREKKAKADTELTIAKAQELGQRHRDLLDAAMGRMKPADINKRLDVIAGQLKGTNGILLDDAERQKLVDEQEFYAQMLKNAAKAGGAPAPAAPAASPAPMTIPAAATPPAQPSPEAAAPAAPAPVKAGPPPLPPGFTGPVMVLNGKHIAVNMKTMQWEPIPEQ